MCRLIFKCLFPLISPITFVMISTNMVSRFFLFLWHCIFCSKVVDVFFDSKHANFIISVHVLNYSLAYEILLPSGQPRETRSSFCTAKCYTPVC